MTAPDDATIKVAVPVERPQRNWTLYLVCLSLLLNTLVLGVVGLITLNTNHIVTTTNAEDRAVTAHRVRNEEAHAALCEKMDAVVRIFHIDPKSLVDEKGKVVECPKPLTEAEIKALSAHPGD